MERVSGRRCRTVATAPFVPENGAVARNGAKEGHSVKTNSNDDVHIDMDDLTGHNRETLRSGANTLAQTILNIENIISRRQRDPIMSVFVRGDAGDFFVLVFTQ